MTRFYEPDLTANPDSPFVRDASNKLVRRSYWMDLTDQALVMVMTKGIGANLTNDEKRAHLSDLKGEHLIDGMHARDTPAREIAGLRNLKRFPSDRFQRTNCGNYATTF